MAEKFQTFPMNDDTPIQFDWDVYFVIRTLGDEPRYIEQIGKDELGTGETEYALVYNIHYAKVFKTKPSRTLETFIKITGIKAAYQQVPKSAYEEYQKYFQYISGRRNLTHEERKKLMEEQQEYRMEHKLDKHFSPKILGGKF